jgi:hypothetical protein
MGRDYQNIFGKVNQTYQFSLVLNELVTARDFLIISFFFFFKNERNSRNKVISQLTKYTRISKAIIPKK